jgi:putative nucleotidyltransferase with HDIG domain
VPSVNVELNERLTKEAVLARIPAFSPGILRVMDLISKPDESASTLAQAIGADPALSAQVLRLANSALFGAQARIDTVQKAVTAVGNSWLQHLTLTLGVSRYMAAAGRSQELQRCWRHMLASAVLSRELAKFLGQPPDRAYTAGLLHDIGRLGLLAAFPGQYARALHESARDGAPLLEMERDTFGTDHAELGRCLVENWHLPAEFGPVVGGHHEAPAETGSGLETVVQLACGLADTLGFFFVPSPHAITLAEVRQMLPPFAQHRFPDDASQLAQIVEEAMQESELGPAEQFEPLPVAEDEMPAEPEADSTPVLDSEAIEKPGWIKRALTALPWFR